MLYRFILLSFLFFISTVSAASEGLWTDVSSKYQARSATKLSLLPDKYRLLQLDEQGLVRQLGLATETSYRKRTKNSTFTLKLPLPNGDSLSVKVEPSRIMAPKLAAKYPSIKTYRVDVNKNKGTYGVIDMSKQGFHAMLFMADGQRLFIDPRKAANKKFYISYYDKDYHPADKKPYQCTIKEHNHKDKSESGTSSLAHRQVAHRSGTDLKTYRLAMAATGEYTDHHGGTVASALAAIVTTISRVNVIYERDLAVRLELIANTDQLIHTDTTTYNNDDGEAILDVNQALVDAAIGVDNYDLGHVFSTGGGGLATLASVCGTNKAEGVTGTSQPQGDPFDIDFVAHEIGHQFGGTHTFNSETEACGGGNRIEGTAYEPGSGVTIMGYAGICGETNNVQNNSDAMFHSTSIEQMSAYITGGGSCGVDSSLNNQSPTANAGGDYTIPANTPFELTGVGGDPNSSDTLSYSWEQVDSGAASNIDVVNQNNAIFRTFLPKNTPTRVFPSLSSILNNTPIKGEVLPDIARHLNFSFVVRDQKGGVTTDEMLVAVSNSSGFQISSHTTNETLSAGASTNIVWDVANTSASPVSCSHVDISLMTDNGEAFISLLSATPNDGNQTVTIPINVADSTTARLKVKCSNNIFFAVSNTNLITQSALTLKTPIISNLGSNALAEPGETLHLTLPLQNNAIGMISNLSGTLSSTASGVNVMVANSLYPDIPQAVISNNTTDYQLFIPATHECGVDIPLSLNTSYEQGSQESKSFNFSIASIGLGSKTETPVQAEIPDNSPPETIGMTSTVTVSGFGVVAHPSINIDIDISHTFRGDIELELVSPQGTTVKLKGESNSDGIENIIGNFPNNLTPVDSLSAFDGENIDGIWTLKVSDRFADDTGTLNSWTLHYKSEACESAVNTAPVASNSSLTTSENIVVSGTLQGSDADNNGLTYTLVSNGSKGSAVITNTATGAFTFTPTSGQSGQDSFTFTINDGTATSNTATVSITINPVDNDSDNDGIPDTWEIANGTNPLIDDTQSDNDSDGLSNLREYQLGTDPTNVDTDGDGINDGTEVDNGTDPAQAENTGSGNNNAVNLIPIIMMLLLDDD